MYIRRFFSLLLVLALLVSGAALAEQSDPEARIAELEAQVEELTQKLEEAEALIRDYEEKSYVVTFDGGGVTVEEAQAQYDYVASMYQSYGYSIAGYEDYIRKDLVDMLAERAVVNFKAEELGYADLDEETMAAYEQEAAATHESYVASYISYFTEDGMSDEEAREETEEYLKGIGYDYDGVLKSMVQTHAQQALFDELTKDVTVDDIEVRAAFDEAVEADAAAYADNARDYESARTDGADIYWNPEGYRQVKHILFTFDDDQAARYKDLKAQADDLEARIEAATAPAEDAEAADAETEEAADAVEGDEETEPVDVAALEEQLTGTMAELEALYQELMPKAEEAIARFEAGEDFDALMAEYGEDPGMQNEPGMTNGYYVSANSEVWDPAFTEGAMSIQNIGEISAPVFGSYGIHIIYYMADVPVGPVDFESVRETLAATALDTKKTNVYNDQVHAWMEELNVEYHMENFR